MAAGDISAINPIHIPCFICGVRLVKGHTKKCCAQCKKIYYCSKECQATHWPDHKPVCKLIRDSPALPTLAQVRAHQDRRDAILFDDSPAEDRIHWGSPDSRVPAYIAQLNPFNLHSFAASKWIATDRRGGIWFDIDRALPSAGNMDIYPWMKWEAFQHTRHPGLQELVKSYDPAYEVPVFFYSIDEDERGMDVWPYMVSTGYLPVCLKMGRRTAEGDKAVLAEIVKTKLELLLTEVLHGPIYQIWE